jgi:hypothetical protein
MARVYANSVSELLGRVHTLLKGKYMFSALFSYAFNSIIIPLLASLFFTTLKLYLLDPLYDLNFLLFFFCFVLGLIYSKFKPKNYPYVAKLQTLEGLKFNFSRKTFLKKERGEENFPLKIEKLLFKLRDFLVRDFIKSWYSHLTCDRVLTEEVKHVLDAFCFNFILTIKSCRHDIPAVLLELLLKASLIQVQELREYMLILNEL